MPMVSKEFATGICRTEFEIDAAEYIAIGRVTVQWAYLEHGVYAITKSIAESAGTSLPSDALNTSFKRRLAALRRSVEKLVAEPGRSRLLKLVSQIANAQADRHKITHGMWEWDKTNPDRISASSFRPGFEFEKSFNSDRINKLADKIAEISCALEYPDGMESVWESHADENGNVSFFHISRQLHRESSSRTSQAQTPSDPTTP